MKHLQKGQPFVREGGPFQLSERVARSWCGRVAPVAAFYGPLKGRRFCAVCARAKLRSAQAKAAEHRDQESP